MNRRTLLTTMAGKKAIHLSSALPIAGGLEPYTGVWKFEQAAHLLRRAMFGPTFEQINQAIEQGMDATVSTLLKSLPLPQPPLNDNPNDPNVRLWDTWVDKAVPQGDSDTVNKRRLSLRSWMIGELLDEGVSIREKMTLLFMDHFVVELFIIRDPTYMYKHITLMREYATGNFKELVKKVTIDPAMLRYLDGNKNGKDAPNENYARELLELFTVGKGNLVGPGDYSTFTEQDVEQMARVLTGWKDNGFYKQQDNIPVRGEFDLAKHDTGSKQLSYHFNNAVITNKGDKEYEALIDIIFNSPKLSVYICEVIYRYFVYYEITDQVRKDVIEPMAKLFVEENYEIKPVLDVLLKSTHFYDILNVGAMIKNPTDFMVTAFKQFKVEVSRDLEKRYALTRKMYAEITDMQMPLFDPPDVAGWKAYYQEPLFYRIWINSVTLPVRATFSNKLATTGFISGTVRSKIDVLWFVEKVADPADPNVIVTDFAKLLFPRQISTGQIKALKEILIPGLPDFEWTLEYNDYKQNPNDDKLKKSVEQKLQNLVMAMMNMAEYYLS